MPLITQTRFASVQSMPIAMPQTELRRGRILNVASFSLSLGEELDIRSLTLHLTSILTPEAPDYINAKFGFVFAFIATSPSAYGSSVTLFLPTPGAVSLNPFAKKTFRSPGKYYVGVANNTKNLDLTAVLTGAVKLYA